MFMWYLYYLREDWMRFAAEAKELGGILSQGASVLGIGRRHSLSERIGFVGALGLPGNLCDTI